MTGEIETGKGWLHVMIYEEPESLRRLNALLTSTQRLMARAESALLSDPTVYENLVQFLEGARRSFLLRSLIRSTIQPAGAGQPGGQPGGTDGKGAAATPSSGGEKK